MKRWLKVACLGIVFSATNLSRGEEVEWRAVGSPPKPTTVEPAKQSNEPVKQTKHADQPASTPPAPKLISPYSSPIRPQQVAQSTPTEVVSPPQKSNSSVPAIVNSVSTSDPCNCNCCPERFTPCYEPGPNRMYLRAEFLSWWTRSAGGPPLLTTSTTPLPVPDANGNVPISALGNIGAFGVPGTVVLLNSSDLDSQYRPGARFGFGYWCDCCGTRGIDGSIFFTGRQSQRFDANSDQFSSLFRPFFAANPIPDLGNQPGQFREIVAATSLGINGAFAAENRSFFWGADLNYRRCLWRGCSANADVFAGFRYLNLDESLDIYESIQATRSINFVDDAGNVVSNLPAGSTFVAQDHFKTDNDFYGGQVGVDATFQRDRWSLNVRPSVALGVTHQQVCISGNSTANVPGVGTQNNVGGLLALNSNIGCFTKNPFTVVPELQLRLGYQLTQRLKVTVGYDFLYWSEVVRPADQIDFTLDTNRVPPPQTPVVTPARPAVVFHSTDFWAMGFNTGLEYRW